VRKAALALSAYAAVALATPHYPSRLPAGRERAIAEQACLLCHSPQLIAQQHKDAAAWEKTLIQMEKWGAPLTPAQHVVLKAWLVRKFGPSGAAKGPPAAR
jgi:hypothetical protein